MITLEIALPVAAALIVAGMFVYRQLMTAAQPARLRLAEKGERFLAREDVPAELRSDVEAMLDDAFPNSVLFLLLAGILAPILVPLTVNDLRARQKAMSNAKADVRGAYLEISALHRRVSLANHPFALPILELEVGLISTLTIAVGSFTSRQGGLMLDRDGIIISLEQHQRQLRLAPARRVVA